MKTAVIYCRVSSKEQLEGTSLDTQEKTCRDYAQAHDLSVIRVFREEGESAKYAERTQLLALLTFCQQRGNAVDALIVFKLDRFARNVEDHFHVKAMLRRASVTVVSATEPIQQDANGKLMEAILAGFAQFDNEIRTAHTIRGLRQRLQSGIHPWKPPIGYRAAQAHGGKKTHPDEPDPNTFEIIREVWTRYASGLDSQADLVRFLNRAGVLTPRGQKVRQEFVYRLLTTPFYAGLLVDPWSGEQLKGRHVAMVSTETFAAVQSRIKRRGYRKSPYSNQVFSVRGLVRCATCGHHLTASTSKGHTKRYGYYRCYNVECPLRNRSIPARIVHDEFGAFLYSSSIHPAIVPGITAMVIALTDVQSRSRHTRRQSLLEKAAQIEKDLSALIQLVSRGLLSESEFTMQRDSLRRQKTTTLAQAAKLAVHRTGEQEVAAVLTRATDLKTLSASFSLGDRQKFQRLLFPGGYAFGSIGTADISPLCLLKRAAADGDSYLAAFLRKNWNSLQDDFSQFALLIERAKRRIEPEAA